MISAGYSPSVRLFEAAACGVPIISDRWPGLDEFFAPSKEILVCNGPLQVLEALRTIPKEVRSSIGEAARRRVLQNHTAEIRAATLEKYHHEAARPHVLEGRRKKAGLKVGATV
jgi:spore maturation protein CgeB